MNDDPQSARDRLVEIRVQGMRALDDVRLPLGGLTVLIGDNGTGKSTLVEALELLRAAARPGSFLGDQVLVAHGGLGALLRVGAPALRISARIEGAGAPIDYAFSLAFHGSGMLIAEERLDLQGGASGGEPLRLIDRDLSGGRFFDAGKGKMNEHPVNPGALLLTAFGAFAHPAVQRVIDVFERGVVHVPFQVAPQWVTRQPNPLRAPSIVGQVSGLERLGGNLANCYHVLSTSPVPGVWQRTLERVRAGLGLDVVDVRTPPAARGEIELAVQFRSLAKPIPAASLSDGQLTYLAFVALAELGTAQSFLAFDEPEAHLHPELLVRVVWLLEELSRSCPVVICTHSDRLLDALSAPERSVVLCELTEQRATRLLRPDKEVLARWLERFRGLGDLRAGGYGAHVLTEPLVVNAACVALRQPPPARKPTPEERDRILQRAATEDRGVRAEILARVPSLARLVRVVGEWLAVLDAGET
jgi:predicted ATPase